MKILFFIESLTGGGKERRLLELIQYLKLNTDFELVLVLTEDTVHYDYVYNLDVPIKIIERKRFKKDPLVFIKFYNYCRSVKPDIIQTWGIMNTFYALPAKLLLRIPLVASMITTSKRVFKPISFSSLFFHASCYFSDTIISNSQAGLRAFNIDNSDARVIYNGVRLERFQQNFNRADVRTKLGIRSEYVIIMVASFSKLKNFDLFLDVAKTINEIRADVTFIGVGDGDEWRRILDRVNDENIKNVILTGRRADIESLINTSDIGVLFPNLNLHGEGISNSIIEYMALGKPVITTDIYGGSREIIKEGETGYCIEPKIQRISETINSLLDNAELRAKMGKKGKEIIAEKFSLDAMGHQFESIYEQVLTKKNLNREIVYER
jgi:glycosyltransferase involved in cell wall biosynthesis